MSSFLGSIEFYVIAAFVAAAVIAAASRPSRKSAARTFFYAGEPVDDPGAPHPAEIECEVDDRGNMHITRRGLEGVSEDGALSLAVEIIGLDVTIKERLTPGRNGFSPVTAMRATIDCLASERYHFQYLSETTKTGTAFYLTVKPGNSVVRELKA